MQLLYRERFRKLTNTSTRQQQTQLCSTNPLQEILWRLKSIGGFQRWSLFKHSQELLSQNLPKHIFICFHTNTIMTNWSFTGIHSNSPWNAPIDSISQALKSIQKATWHHIRDQDMVYGMNMYRVGLRIYFPQLENNNWKSNLQNPSPSTQEITSQMTFRTTFLSCALRFLVKIPWFFNQLDRDSQSSYLQEAPTKLSDSPAASPWHNHCFLLLRIREHLLKELLAHHVRAR